MNPKEVVSYIEGEPLIGVVPAEPGLTNAGKEENGQRIVGMNTESAEINEGLIRFDIIFYMHLTDDKLLGSYPWKGGIDLLNIVLIGIANEFPEHDEKYELHRLLSTLLSAELTVDEKLGIIKTEYSIPASSKAVRNWRQKSSGYGFHIQPDSICPSIAPFRNYSK